MTSLSSRDPRSQSQDKPSKSSADSPSESASTKDNQKAIDVFHGMIGNKCRRCGAERDTEDQERFDKSHLCLKCVQAIDLTEHMWYINNP